MTLHLRKIVRHGAKVSLRIAARNELLADLAKSKREPANENDKQERHRSRSNIFRLRGE